jgi:alpha-1,6-mannosyltransferase
MGLSISTNTSGKGVYAWWGLAGSTLAGLFIFLSSISPAFDSTRSVANKPIISLAAVMMLSGLVYVLVVLRLRKTAFNKTLLMWIIAIGILLRFSMLGSTPMLEDDHFRYLWDGGVLANGFNPYTYSPRDMLDKQVQGIPEDLSQLARDAGPIIERVNHPWLRTIYPPITESAFALAHFMSPWSLASWRLVLAAADVITLLLLVAILRVLNVSLAGLVIYWWNPLLVKEIYNSGHMDVLIFPFILGALLFVTQRRYVLASGALGLAVGIKFWPLILLPVVLRPILREPRRLVPSLLVFSCLALVMFLPICLVGFDSESGFKAYGEHWEMNDALFMLILWTVQLLIKAFAFDASYAQLLARAAVAGILVAWTLWLIRKDESDPAVISRRFLLVIAALFMLSPTQFPWYYLWMVPFLAITPRNSLIVLTALLPLYYMRFYFAAKGMVDIHDNGIVWLEFVPVWCLLIWEWYKERTPTDHSKELSHPI